ncbi:hypothetical protein QTP88_023471 [Uroleucon formosanum]
MDYQVAPKRFSYASYSITRISVDVKIMKCFGFEENSIWLERSVPETTLSKAIRQPIPSIIVLSDRKITE